MKKILLAALLLVAICLNTFAFAGCSGNKTQIADFVIPETGFDTETPVTIKFYHTMGAKYLPTLEEYIPQFQALYPNITVIQEAVGSYDDVRDQISTELTVGNQPNIAYCYPDHVALYNVAKAVVPLDSLIASTIEITRADGTKEILGLTDAQIADFIPAYYNEGKEFEDGKMYTLPMSKSTEVLYYNADFFAKHNLTPPKTWDEMEALCKRIKEIDPDCIPLGYDSEANWFITMCEQYGSDYTSATGDHFLFNNKTNKEFVKRFRDWYQKGYVTTQEIYGSYTSGLFVTTGESHIDEKGNEVKVTKSYMSIGSSAGAANQRPNKVDGAYPFTVGITTIPQVNAEAPKVISQGPSLCIFNKENPQEVIASWLFMKFLSTTPEFQAAFSMAGGYSPVIKSVKDIPVYADFLNKADGGDFITALSVKVCLDQSDAYYTSPAFNGSSTARDQVGALLQKCMTENDGGNLDAMINKAFKDAVDECIYKS